MDLNWSVLITQMIGFLIVLWILKRYAWGPVLGMLEERRRRIAKEVHASERLRQEAEALKAEYENQLKTIEAEARARIQTAVAEAQKVAEEVRADAHRDARAITEKAKANLELEYRKARVELKGEMVAMALGAAERLLREKMDAEEHRRAVERFLTELQEQEAS